jgi:putative membrane protein
MADRYVPIAAIATLLTAAATVAQPQTTTDATTDTSTATGTTATQTTPSASTPATNPGSTTTGTATDTSTGTQGMHGGFRGTPSGSSASGTTTTTDTSTSGTTDTAGASGTTDTSSSAATDAATSATAAGTATATASATGSSALQGQDAEFLRKALEGDRMEIASAQAALDNAQRTDTKNAARMIVEDHQRSSQKLQELASRKGWTLPSATETADSDQAMTSTSGSGSFDDGFMADQIRMHREAISLYRAQASSGSDPDLRQFARDQLPHLEHHLEMLQGSNTQK